MVSLAASRDARLIKKKKSAYPAITLGISACLLGKPVRWDGRDQRDPLFADELACFVRLIPVCPEAESGFGVPREPCRLIGDPIAPRFVTIHTRRDLTRPLRQWSRRRIRELSGASVSGLILKDRSPSCGVGQVPVYDERGRRIAVGAGLFARALMTHAPLLPVAAASRLHDPLSLAGFITRVLVMGRWQAIQGQGSSRAALLRFHDQHELVLLAHSPHHCRYMGRLVARDKGMSRTTLYREYGRALLEALQYKATRTRHCRCLLNATSHLKKDLSPAARQKLLAEIAAYRQGRCSRSAPLAMINRYVRLFKQPSLEEQHYLHPHPLEL
jgi:uncharacterized protein YbbK (DUF523 family)/uncharacterized protein YbgA (DUF1722 family)